MSQFLQKIKPELPLRLGLGFMYFYSGRDLLLYPSGWTWALPLWFSNIINQTVPIETYLRMQGVVELLMAFILLSWFLNRNFVKIVAAISSVEFIFILLFAPQFSITFRDIGLLGAALALLIMILSRSPDTQPSR